MEFLDRVYAGNSVQAYLIAAGAALAVWLALRIALYLFRREVTRLAKRTTTTLDDAAVQILAATRRWLSAVVALYVGSLFLTVPPRRASTFRTLAVVAILLQVGFWGGAAITAAVDRLRQRRSAAGDTSGSGAMTMLSVFGRVVAWAVVGLLVLENLGVDITALVTGLGIGGIAVALAVQNVLQDLFASVSIMLDKPFEVGDTIQVGDMTGVVLSVGIKTTRLRSVGGEQIVFPNHDLLGSRIRNLKRMQERRAVLTIGVSYQTPVETIEQIPLVLREVVEKQDRVRFDRAHLKNLGDSALEYEVVYFMTTPDFLAYMDTQQRIQIEILRRLAALRCDVAYGQRALITTAPAPARS